MPLAERQAANSNVAATNSSNLAAIIGGSGSASGDSSTSATNTTTSTGAPCDMLANVAGNQQVSWSSNFIQTCCTDTAKATCFIRSNDDGSGSATVKADPTACYQVPSCSTLLQGDSSSMAGFRALNSTWGKGAQQNAYYYKTAADGALSQTMAASTYVTIAIAATFVTTALLV